MAEYLARTHNQPELLKLAANDIACASHVFEQDHNFRHFHVRPIDALGDCLAPFLFRAFSDCTLKKEEVGQRQLSRRWRKRRTGSPRDESCKA
mgnify:CR=1 FL=1